MTKEQILEWVEDMLISGIKLNRMDDDLIVEGRNFYIVRLVEMIIKCKGEKHFQDFYERRGIKKSEVKR
jgi:hypothetical protein